MKWEYNPGRHGPLHKWTELTVSPSPARIRLDLQGVSAEQAERMYTAFMNGQHLHLADVFGGDEWKVQSVTKADGSHGEMELAVSAVRADPSPEPVDKFGNHTT